LNLCGVVLVAEHKLARQE